MKGGHNKGIDLNRLQPSKGNEKSMPANPKHTTAEQTQPRPSLLLPGQAEFQQHLKELARRGLRILLEAVMDEELAVLVGAKWGEHTAERRGYRNGYYARDLRPTSV